MAMEDVRLKKKKGFLSDECWLLFEKNPKMSKNLKCWNAAAGRWKNGIYRLSPLKGFCTLHESEI